MVLSGVLRGLLTPRLATTVTKSTTSKPCRPRGGTRSSLAMARYGDDGTGTTGAGADDPGPAGAGCGVVAVEDCAGVVTVTVGAGAVTTCLGGGTKFCAGGGTV